MNTQYLVLLSLYYKERPEYLRESLDSLVRQTVVSDDIVLVEDGRVGDALERVVREYEDRYPQLHVVRYEKNRGLGHALNDGLRHCRHELVARMDTDDIAKPRRMEVQVGYLVENPGIDVVGSWTEEFEGDASNVVALRKLPEFSQEIYAFGRKRNPLNHPTVMFRKGAVMRSGGYKPFHLFEDYYLWVRMLKDGAKFHNIQAPLLSFRTSLATYNRRGGWRYAMTELKFMIMMHDIGYTNQLTTLENVVRRIPVRLAPNRIRNMIYNLIRK